MNYITSELCCTLFVQLSSVIHQQNNCLAVNYPELYRLYSLYNCSRNKSRKTMILLHVDHNFPAFFVILYVFV